MYEDIRVVFTTRISSLKSFWIIKEENMPLNTPKTIPPSDKLEN